MQVYDKVNKTELTADTEELIKLMAPGGRQVDLYLKEKKSDEDGYMTWDVEHWSSVDGRRFIRCYSLEGRVLSESTGHNIYDLKNEFKPEEAEKVDRWSNMYQFVDDVLYKKKAERWEIEVHSSGGRTGVVGREKWRHMWLSHRIKSSCR